MTPDHRPRLSLARASALASVTALALVGCQTPPSAPSGPAPTLQLIASEPMNLPASCQAEGSYFVSFTVLEDGRQVDTLRPEKRFYKKPEQPTTEVAIRSTLGADLYLVLGSYDADTHMATILAYLNPLIGFLYWGGITLALGTLIVIWPAPATAREPAYAPGGAREGAQP